MNPEIPLVELAWMGPADRARIVKKPSRPGQEGLAHFLRGSVHLGHADGAAPKKNPFLAVPGRGELMVMNSAIEAQKSSKA
jgi:hypothetical protein